MLQKTHWWIFGSHESWWIFMTSISLKIPKWWVQLQKKSRVGNLVSHWQQGHTQLIIKLLQLTEKDFNLFLGKLTGWPFFLNSQMLCFNAHLLIGFHVAFLYLSLPTIEGRRWQFTFLKWTEINFFWKWKSPASLILYLFIPNLITQMLFVWWFSYFPTGFKLLFSFYRNTLPLMFSFFWT